MKKIVQRMVRRFLFAVWTVPIGVKRQQGDGFGQNSDAGVYGRGLERCFLIHRFSAGAGAEEKAGGAVPEAVFRTGSRWEKILIGTVFS